MAPTLMPPTRRSPRPAPRVRSRSQPGHCAQDAPVPRPERPARRPRPELVEHRVAGQRERPPSAVVAIERPVKAGAAAVAASVLAGRPGRAEHLGVLDGALLEGAWRPCGDGLNRG